MKTRFDIKESSSCTQSENMKKGTHVILLIITMLFWAGNFHVVKIALEFYSPMGVAAMRFLLGAIVLLIIVYKQFGKRLFKFEFSKREWGHMFLTSFFGIFLTIYFFNQGLRTTSAINGSLIIATSPAITAMFSFAFMKRKVTLTQWIAIVISFTGVVIILVKGDFNRLSQLQFESGDVYILLMAIVFSLSQIIVSKYLSQVDAIIMTTITSFMALVLFAIFSIPELISTELPSDIIFWASIVYMSVLGTGIAYTAFYYCVVKLGATISTLYMNLIPFFAVLLAIPFGETIDFSQITGGCIVIGGLLLFNLNQKLRGS